MSNLCNPCDAFRCKFFLSMLRKEVAKQLEELRLINKDDSEKIEHPNNSEPGDNNDEKPENPTSPGGGKKSGNGNNNEQ